LRSDAVCDELAVSVSISLLLYYDMWYDSQSHCWYSQRTLRKCRISKHCCFYSRYKLLSFYI